MVKFCLKLCCLTVTNALIPLETDRKSQAFFGPGMKWVHGIDHEVVVLQCSDRKRSSMFSSCQTICKHTPLSHGCLHSSLLYFLYIHECTYLSSSLNLIIYVDFHELHAGTLPMICLSAVNVTRLASCFCLK